MLVTALSPVIGYDKASKIAHYAYDNDLTLKEAALRLGSRKPSSIGSWTRARWSNHTLPTANHPGHTPFNESLHESPIRS